MFLNYHLYIFNFRPTPLTPPTRKKGGRCRDTTFPSIPLCKCGSVRKFEFQLMPSLLHLLEVDKYCKESTTNQKTNLEQVLNKNEGGMNWGVIAIYSCSNSCNQSIEEYVVIQESVDTNPQKIANDNNANANNDSDDDDDN